MYTGLIALGAALLWLPAEVFSLGMTKQRRLELREEVKQSFYHAYNGYMEHGFPFDELNPITCSGRGRDSEIPDNINVNDVLGDYLLTLVDTLDTLAIMGDKKEFALAVKNTIKHLPSFDVDSHVQVFEVTIRMLGGLLSAHIIATDENDTLGMRLDTLVDSNGTAVYNGELLRLARDLGYRLLPAFEASPTGIPYPRTNLKRGFNKSETSKTCAAGAGTLLLEFGTLSRLTNETIFEQVARHALNELWNERSKKNLFGNTFDIKRRTWISRTTGIGAGVDSLYEYMLKSYVYFGNPEYLEIFEASYSALLQHARDTVGGYAFFNVDMDSIEVASTWVDSLSAFFPGLMVLAGDVDGAESAYMLYYHIWRRFRAIPERFNLFLREPDILFYPLRPEFIESTYFLYQATRDPFYLDVGEMVLEDINELYRTACGFASLHSVFTGELEERMESFLLSETFKYLYLLFDEENPLHKKHSNYVFTTEAHVLLPLSPVHANGSTQYHAKSSFGTRSLIHSESPPSADMNPLFYSVENIKKKLQSVHPNDMFAFPTVPGADTILKANTKTSQRMQRQCIVPRALEITKVGQTAGNTNKPAAAQFVVGWRNNRQPSPLAQLHVTRELSRAIASVTGNSQKEYQERVHLAALFLNSGTVTMPLRADFYNIGMLVKHGLCDEDHWAGGRNTRSPMEETLDGKSGIERVLRNGTMVLKESLAMAMDYDGLCIVSSDLYLSEKQNVWMWTVLEQANLFGDNTPGLHNPPTSAETWLTPNTRQVAFMEFVMSRATGRGTSVSIVPSQPRARRGVPLLRDVGDSEQREPVSSDVLLRRRGYQMLADKEEQKEQGKVGQQETKQPNLIITNGAGQVLSDYVVVRVKTDASLHNFMRVSPVHNDSIHTIKRSRPSFFSRSESVQILGNYHNSNTDKTAYERKETNNDNDGNNGSNRGSDRHLADTLHKLDMHDIHRRHRTVIGELEEYLAAGLHVSMELL
ncbi:hypothetical protein GGI07_001578 [Coemansia sp. Benny D115]|nr:hypothetical protein GGI07_001578 [Coemansia sp. Benny D115]